jgi:hypothetical protein
VKENSIEEALEKLSTGKKIKMYELLRTFKREGIENFVITRKKYVDVILSDYKRVLKENEQLSTEVNSLKKENEELKEYILIAPNLDEMTATKYRNSRQDAYIQGRAEEQQKAEQIIYENYIPIQKVKDKLVEYKKVLLSCNRFSDVDRIKAINERILELQELIEKEN